ncbi:MAG: phosphotransferase, partial [Deinococcota bacterium]|nr:phosphotransferase [Deinococcota bacterium]
MLSAHDRDIIRRDHRLPGLATVLDPEIFADALRSALPDVTLEEPSVRYLRYKPGTNCLVAYRLKLDGRVSEVHAKAHRKDAFDKLHNALEKHRGESAMSPVIPSPLILEPMVAVYAFPSDRKLRALVKLADGAKRKRMLVKLLPGHLELHGARLRPLRYKPERRFVAQLVTAVGAQAVVKLYDNHDFPRARRGARVFRPAGPLALAPLLGGSSGQQALVWPWLSGRPLDQALRGARFNPASARTVGAALAALHAQKAESLEPLSRKEEIHSLFAAANALAFLLPELAARARRLALALASALMASPQQGCALHGDFSADQALLARGEAVL